MSWVLSPKENVFLIEQISSLTEEEQKVLQKEPEQQFTAVKIIESSIDDDPEFEINDIVLVLTTGIEKFNFRGKEFCFVEKRNIWGTLYESKSI